MSFSDADSSLTEKRPAFFYLPDNRSCGIVTKVNIEQIEHILNDLNGEPVIVVVPFYGHVSFSVSGLLSVVSLECPMIFTVTSMPSVLWDSNDIREIETPEASSERSHKIIIRLKGPHDYAETYQTSH